eukprot:gene43835-32551_t
MALLAAAVAAAAGAVKGAGHLCVDKRWDRYAMHEEGGGVGASAGPMHHSHLRITLEMRDGGGVAPAAAADGIDACLKPEAAPRSDAKGALPCAEFLRESTPAPTQSFAQSAGGATQNFFISIFTTDSSSNDAARQRAVPSWTVLGAALLCVAALCVFLGVQSVICRIQCDAPWTGEVDGVPLCLKSGHFADGSMIDSDAPSVELQSFDFEIQAADTTV